MKNMNNKSWFKAIAVFVALGMICMILGCGGKMTLIQTKPSGAEIRVNGQIVGESPTQVKLKKKKSVILAEKEGYEDAMQITKGEANGGCIAAVVIVGLLLMPLALFALPACWEAPDNVYLKLERIEGEAGRQSSN